MLLVLFLGALLVLPWVVTPQKQEEKQIVLKDSDGNIAETELDIFDDTIYPGTNGSYYFSIENTFDQGYSFALEECLQGEKADTGVPILYRLKMDGKYVGSDEWKTIGDMHFDASLFPANSTSRFVLEWQWLFESGNDALDTFLGENAVEYAIKLIVTVE